MPLQKVNIDIPLNQGLDTEAHKFAVAPPRLTKAENVVFDELGAITKRQGFTQDSIAYFTWNSTTAVALNSYNKKPLITLETDNQDDDSPGWTTMRRTALGWNPAAIEDNGTPSGIGSFHLPAKCSLREVPFAGSSRIHTDMAVGSFRRCYAWHNPDSGEIEVVLTDLDYQVVGTYASFTGEKPHVRYATGPASNGFYVFYADSGHIYYRYIVASTGNMGAATSITTGMAAIIGATTHDTIYDVSNEEGGILWFVMNDAAAAGYDACRFDTSTNTVTHAITSTNACTSGVAICEPRGGLQVPIVRDDGTNCRVDWRTASVLGLGGSTNVAISGAVPEVSANCTVVILNNSGTATGNGDEAHVLFDAVSTRAAIWGGVVTTAGVVTNNQLQFTGGMLASRASAYTRKNGIEGCLANVIMCEDQGTPAINTSLMTLDFFDNNGYANADQYGGGLAEAGAVAQYMSGTVFEYNASSSYSNTGHLPNLQPDPTDALQLYTVQPFAKDVASFSREFNTGRFAPAPGVDALVGAKEVHLTLYSTDALRATPAGDSLYFPGALPVTYSGGDMVETHFHNYPKSEIITYSVLGGTGLLPDNVTYQYRFYWEWRNSAGELERSTFAQSINVSISTGFGVNAVTFTVTPVPTMKPGVALVCYRTVDGPGTTFYRLSESNSGSAGAGVPWVNNDPTATALLFSDNGALTDTQLQTRETDDFSSGLIDSVLPELPKFYSFGKNRMWYCTDSWEERSRVRYSLERVQGQTVRFNDGLWFDVPEEGGSITAIEAGEDYVWVFKETATYMVTGQGPDPLGRGAFSPPQQVSPGIGCDSHYSLARIPQGVLFRGNRGWYIAGRGQSLQYVGFGVADYDSEAINDSCVDTENNRALFITDNRTLVYDFRVNAWSTWSISGSRITSIDGTIYYLDSSGNYLYQTATYQDAGSNYSALVETSWIPLSGLAGFGRAYRWGLLGEYKSAHGLQVRVGHDRSATWNDTWTVDMSGTGSVVGDSFKVKRRFGKQKTDAVRFEISDVTTTINLVNEPEDFSSALPTTLTIGGQTDPTGGATAYQLGLFTAFPDTGAWYDFMNGTNITTVIGQPYTFSMWVKHDTANEVRLRVHDGSSIIGSSSFHSGSNAWERLSVTVTATTTATQFRVYLDSGYSTLPIGWRPMVENSSTVSVWGRSNNNNGQSFVLNGLTVQVGAKQGIYNNGQYGYGSGVE